VKTIKKVKIQTPIGEGTLTAKSDGKNYEQKIKVGRRSVTLAGKVGAGRSHHEMWSTKGDEELVMELAPYFDDDVMFGESK
jgi:hypothetical protein